MIKLINDLTSESSTLGKIELLKNFNKPDLLKEILYYTYNPFLNFYIRKIKVQKNKGRLTINTNWPIAKKVFDDLNGRTVTGGQAIALVEQMLSLFDKDSQELLVKVTKRDLKCNVSTKTINKVFPGLIPTFEVQLANKYDPEKKYKDTLWAASPKMDGLRCVFVRGKLFSRNGKELVGFDHIIEELKGLGDYDLIDGELYSPLIPFQMIQGVVLSNKKINVEDKMSIKYNIFALIKDGLTTKKMIDTLNAFREKCYMYNHLRFVPYEIIDNDPNEIYRLDKEFVSKGFEGVMLRSLNKIYDFKRSDALLKFKSFREEDFLCTGTYEGEPGDKYEDSLGGIYIKGVVDGKHIKCKCGSGFNETDRDHFWQYPNEIVGHKVEIKFQGLTDDGVALRFPIFKGTKDDR